MDTNDALLLKFSRLLDTNFDEKLEPVKQKLSELEVKLSELEVGIGRLDRGALWETHNRAAVKEQFGQSFSKEYTVSSLQHLATRVCSASGWAGDKVPATTYGTAHKLAEALNETKAAEQLLRSLFSSLQAVPEDAEQSFLGWSRQVTQLDPWFRADGSLDRSAMGRSLSLIPEDKLQRKLGLLHFLLGERPGPPSLCCLPRLSSQST